MRQQTTNFYPKTPKYPLVCLLPMKKRLGIQEMAPRYAHNRTLRLWRRGMTEDQYACKSLFNTGKISLHECYVNPYPLWERGKSYTKGRIRSKCASEKWLQVTQMICPKQLFPTKTMWTRSTKKAPAIHRDHKRHFYIHQQTKNAKS